MKPFLVHCALLATLAGCGGGSSTTTVVAPTLAPVPTPVPSTAPNALVLSPSTLTFTADGYQLPFASTEGGYTGALTASSADCAGIATFTPSAATGPSAAFTVTSAAAGQCHLSVADANGQHAVLTIVITTLTGNIQ